MTKHTFRAHRVQAKKTMNNADRADRSQEKNSTKCVDRGHRAQRKNPVKHAARANCDPEKNSTKHAARDHHAQEKTTVPENNAQMVMVQARPHMYQKAKRKGSNTIMFKKQLWRAQTRCQPVEVLKFGSPPRVGISQAK